MNQFNYTMLCAVDNEKIYQVDQYGRKEIGVLMKHYTDTMELLKKFQEKSEQYKKMLEDAGILKKEKTVQEIQEEQNDKAIDVLSEIMYELKKHYPSYYAKYDKKLEEIYGHHVMSVEEARDYVRHFVNKDGTTGAHWTMEQTKNYQATHEEVEDLNPVCFYVAMNMMYSDYYQPERKTDTYAILAKDFLEDEDAPKDKLKRYLKAMHS